MPVRYVPNVSAFATDPADPEILPVTAEPLMAMAQEQRILDCYLRRQVTAVQVGEQLFCFNLQAVAIALIQ